MFYDRSSIPQTDCVTGLKQQVLAPFRAVMVDNDSQPGFWV